MRKTLIIFLLATILFNCKKSRLCISKNKLKISELDESNLPFHTYSHNNNTIKIPQYFTPNGDGVNDYFFPRVDSINSGISSYKLIISTKCENVYITDNFKTGWGGDHKGERIKNGKYNFELKIKWEDETSETFEEKLEIVY